MMRRALPTLAALSFALGAPVAAADAQAAAPAPMPPVTLVVRRSATDSVVLGAAQLAALPRTTVAASEHGHRATFAGAALGAVLAAAGVKLDSLHGPALTDVLVFEARDGYQVAFTLGELSPDLGGRAVLVADRRDGAALGAAEGPLRLVVAGDGRPARWIRQLRAVTVVHAGAPAR